MLRIRQAIEPLGYGINVLAEDCVRMPIAKDNKLRYTDRNSKFRFLWKQTGVIFGSCDWANPQQYWSIARIGDWVTFKYDPKMFSEKRNFELWWVYICIGITAWTASRVLWGADLAEVFPEKVSLGLFVRLLALGIKTEMTGWSLWFLVY